MGSNFWITNLNVGRQNTNSYNKIIMHKIKKEIGLNAMVLLFVSFEQISLVSQFNCCLY